ncbi:MAG: hypothetical protein IPL26_00265 [Leptospiraceae bacterium]|nr:hypothetical protein [Leptospiraceae bacterium]
MISITDTQKIKKNSQNKLNQKDKLLAIVIPVNPKESIWQYAEVEVFDPTTREIIDRSSFIHVINQIITNPDYPLTRNFIDENKQPVKRKIA